MFYKNILNRLILYLFGIILLSSIFQFYFFHILSSWLSLSTLITVFVSPFIILNNKELLKWKPLFILSLIIFFEFIALFWSSNLKLGFRTIVDHLLFLTIVILAYEATKRYKKKVQLIIYVYFIFVSLFSLLVIFSSISKDFYTLFIHSNIAKVFINPNSIEKLLNSSSLIELNNHKEGVFFINRNVATAFLGINAFFAYGFYIAYSKYFLLIVSSILMVGIIFAGSKAGLIIACGLILFFVLFLDKYKFKINNKNRLIIVLGVFIFSIIALWIRDKYLGLNTIESLVHTTNSRFIIWKHLLNVFPENPILGLGFGGWKDTFYEYSQLLGIKSDYPPHNTLIYIWSQSGIIATVFALYFMYIIVLFGFKLLKESYIELKGLGIALLGGFLWTFIHGMGTNFGLVGDLHMVFILGTILGYSYSRYVILKGLKV